MKKFFVDPDIRRAETLPAYFYQDPEVFDSLKERVFYRSWQWCGDKRLVPQTGSAYPFEFIEGYITEPMLLVLSHDKGVKCLSNVCTHRGNILISKPGKVSQLVCGYHGRRFDLDGRFQSMPEFKEAIDFPRPCDSLHEFRLWNWNGFLFTAIDPLFDFSEVAKVLDERLGFLPLEEFKLDKSLSRDYLVNCHWALYCDNYLEGFHIPFVHEGLNEVLDYGEYETVLYRHLNLQIGYATDSDEVFDLPEGHPDYGRKVAAYYYCLFPNMMFNFYPWGLSVNIVKPISPDQTMVSFISYVCDESKLDRGAGAQLHTVELEDEEVVEAVHKGLKSRVYKTGRFSPSRETAVHHFHSLLANYLNEA